MTIGYVGLGNMGAALARRLQLSEPLLVYDEDGSAMARMVQLGATPCSNLADLAARCDTILLCLPGSQHVRTVLFGENGITRAARTDTRIIDQTTGDPLVTRQMAGQLAERGLELIDAPVSGGVRGADAGTIAIMVGADEAQYKAVRPLLLSISSNVFHAGKFVGAGQVMKLVNNALSGVQRLLTLEAMTLAVKNGIDPERACEILIAGGARNAFLEKFMAPCVVRGDLETGFSLALMHKDIRLACQLGADSAVPMFFANTARELYMACLNEFGAEASVNVSAKHFDRLARTQVVGAVSPSPVDRSAT